MGIGFAFLMGFRPGSGNFDWLYVAVTLALSSTLIVVKLLYDKFELTAVPGRITLGVLVFQDIWAIFVSRPAAEPPQPAACSGLLRIFWKGVLLVSPTLALSRYVLPRLFPFVAKIPELVLVIGPRLVFPGLRRGSHSDGSFPGNGSSHRRRYPFHFPYSLDVIAKVINIRDFFVTLFFVALGMQIPHPSLSVVTAAIGMSIFVLASRLLSVFPVLYALGNGLRASLIPSINLAQMSEFSLVIASLGLALNHISPELVGVLTFVFAITSVLSTYLIAYNHEIQSWLSRLLRHVGFMPAEGAASEVTEEEADSSIVFLGCFREGSSILYEMESQSVKTNGDSLLGQVLVIDFNPVVLRELTRRGIKCIYGDVSNMDTLHHAHVQSAKIVGLHDLGCHPPGYHKPAALAPSETTLSGCTGRGGGGHDCISPRAIRAGR